MTSQSAKPPTQLVHGHSHSQPCSLVHDHGPAGTMHTRGGKLYLGGNMSTATFFGGNVERPPGASALKSALKSADSERTGLFPVPSKLGTGQKWPVGEK